MNDPMDNHKCEIIANVSPVGEGRTIKLGRLIEPIPGYPSETHCLHIETPAKSIVLGVNAGDAAAFATLCQIIHGKPFNQRWLDDMAKKYQKRTT